MKIFVFANEIEPRIQLCCYTGGFILKTFLSHHYIFFIKVSFKTSLKSDVLCHTIASKDATDGIITCIVQIKNERCMDY